MLFQFYFVILNKYHSKLGTQKKGIYDKDNVYQLKYFTTFNHIFFA